MCRPATYANDAYLSAAAASQMLKVSRPYFYKSIKPLIGVYTFPKRKQVFYKRAELIAALPLANATKKASEIQTLCLED